MWDTVKEFQFSAGAKHHYLYLEEENDRIHCNNYCEHIRAAQHIYDQKKWIYAPDFTKKVKEFKTEQPAKWKQLTEEKAMMPDIDIDELIKKKEAKAKEADEKLIIDSLETKIEENQVRVIIHTNREKVIFTLKYDATHNTYTVSTTNHVIQASKGIALSIAELTRKK